MNADTYLKIENNEIKLFRLLAEELAQGAKRVNYDNLAEKLSCARSTVRYNVGKLLSAGVIGTDDGKLYLKSG